MKQILCLFLVVIIVMGKLDQQVNMRKSSTGKTHITNERVETKQTCWPLDYNDGACGEGKCCIEKIGSTEGYCDVC